MAKRTHSQSFDDPVDKLICEPPRQQVEEEAIDQLWTERFKPTKLSEMFGNQSQRNAVQAYVMSVVNMHDTQYPLLLSGPPGVGKTCCAHLSITSQDGVCEVETNTSDVRSATHMQTLLDSCVNRKNVYGDTYALVLDEFDGCSAGAIAAVCNLYKNAKQPVHTPIICICNECNIPSLKPIKKIAQHIVFEPLKKKEAFEYLKQIVKRSGGFLHADEAKHIVLSARGDARQVALSTQLLIGKTELGKQASLTQRRSAKGITAVSTKDIFASQDVFGNTEAFFTEDRAEIKETYAAADTQMTLAMVHEHGLAFCKGVEIAASHLNDLSLLDKKSWELEKYTNTALTLTPISYGSRTLRFPSVLKNGSARKKALTKRIGLDTLSFLRLRLSSLRKKVLTNTEIKELAHLCAMYHIDLDEINIINEAIHSESCTKANMKCIAKFMRA